MEDLDQEMGLMHLHQIQVLAEEAVVEKEIILHILVELEAMV